MISSRKLLVAGLVLFAFAISIAVVGIGFISNSTEQPPTNVSQATVTKSTCERPPGFILIIADLSGFNNSIGHGAPSNPWPVITVRRGDVVRLLVCNKDSTQPHGFAIGTYLDAGVTLAPGDAYRITFTATRPGSFVIYCNIFCTVHVYMVGRLIVSD
jgi:FtsP/CotA-like multicopper oxidase with cupredoxin domain